MSINIQNIFMERLRLENNQKGFVALLGVLVVGAVGLAVALSIIISGTDSLRTTESIERSAKAKNLANACAEQAFQEIRNSTPFEGGGSLNLLTGVCSFEVISGGGQNRTIQSVGVSGDVTRKVEIRINAINPDIEVDFWQEVVDF